MPISTPPIDLSQLKDIHTSTPPSFWPLAKGWYILNLPFSSLDSYYFICGKGTKESPFPML